MKPLDLMASLTGTVRTPATGSASRPYRLAVIDLAYNPATYPNTLPRVLFEGEDTLSERGLSVSGSYVPVPGERVTVAPIGTTYLITGPVSAHAPVPYGVAGVTSHTGITAEAASLTISAYTFRARWAYEVRVSQRLYGTAGNLALFRLRKTSTGGADWGEYGRYHMEGTSAGMSVAANGSLYLIRSASTDLIATFVLTVTPTGGTANVFASDATPRTMMIQPIGPAALYLGMGATVS